jgi:hypothetical protein
MKLSESIKLEDSELFVSPRVYNNMWPPTRTSRHAQAIYVEGAGLCRLVLGDMFDEAERAKNRLDWAKALGFATTMLVSAGSWAGVAELVKHFWR